MDTREPGENRAGNGLLEEVVDTSVLARPAALAGRVLRKGAAFAGRAAALPFRLAGAGLSALTRPLWSLFSAPGARAFAPVTGIAQVNPAQHDLKPLPEEIWPPTDAPSADGGPARRDAFEILYLDRRPVEDLEALAILYTCWPKRTQGSVDARLLELARRLGARFGTRERLPMASLAAWRMLDLAKAEDSVAAQLQRMVDFCTDWEEERKEPLELEPAEYDLVDFLFEALSPVHHADLLFSVLDCRPLGTRRLALVRRIPVRVRRLLDGGRGKAAIGPYAELLERLDGNSFKPLGTEAEGALEKLRAMTRKKGRAAQALTLMGPDEDEALPYPADEDGEDDKAAFP